MTRECFPLCAEPSSVLLAPAAPGLASRPLLRVKPRLRGLSHLVATCVAAPAAVVLWWGAGSWAARWGAAIYGLSLVMLLAMSATYHRPTWRPRARDWMGRLDQAAIFLLIAGTYTPFGLLLGPRGHLLLALAWGAELAGYPTLALIAAMARQRMGAQPVCAVGPSPCWSPPSSGRRAWRCSA